MKIDKQNCKIILWGHKKHAHTHSYIHQGFERAFQHLGYQVFWFNNYDYVENFDFKNSLFITEGQADKKIPLRENCFYVLHNCERTKYQYLFDKNRCLNLQVYTDDVLDRPIDKISECIYYDLPSKCLYMPWATDLLPHEIDANKPKIVFNQNSKIITWVGSVLKGQFSNIDQINAFAESSKTQEINFTISPNKRTIEQNVQLIKDSYMAPALVGEWQQKVGYIPCRIFKNISYGQFGITNSPRVYELFDRKIIFNADCKQLFFNAKTKMKEFSLSELYNLMNYVRDNHTYLNRIKTIFDFIEAI